MRSFVNVLGVHRIRALNPWMVVVLAFSVLVGMVGHVDAQTSRYTIDDVMDKMIEMDKRLSHVMDKVIEMDKRLVAVETDIKNIKTAMKEDKVALRERISDVNTVTITFFTILSVLFGSILVFVFSIARNMRPEESSKAFRKEVREIAKREKALEEKLQAADRSVPKLLEALEEKVSALAERQKELERKLAPAEAV